MDSSGIIIGSKPDNISWAEITELLHLAFAVHLKTGLNYAACTQTVEETISRVGDGMCIVGLMDGILVGCATVHFNGGIGHLSQVAVHPTFQKYGIGRKLQDYIFDYAKANGCKALICDTSEKAVEVVKWYLQTGWQKVGLCSHTTTNYYSVVFRKPVCGRKYPIWEARLRFGVSSCFWRMLLRKNGKVRVLAKPFYLFARKIYRMMGR